MIPTSKALTKNVMSIFDANGVELYHNRRDMMGDKTLGAMGRVVVDGTTIDSWVGAYERGITEMFAEL